jgi:hypothetical protein
MVLARWSIRTLICSVCVLSFVRSGCAGQMPWAIANDGQLAARSPDEYAWRLFVALNWPAAAAPAWETWPNAQNVFLEDGRDPGAWERVAAVPPIADQRRFETVSLKSLPRLRHIVDGHMVSLDDPLAASQRLTEIRMDRAAFEYIRSRQLYNIEGQLAALASAAGVQFPMGATFVKAQWRPIAAEQRPRYHTLTVHLADGSTRLYGLTALHIASKASPRWLWATFEHIDNRTRVDGDGWRLPSRDTFACGAQTPDCERIPQGLRIEQTVWANYRLRGTLTQYVDAAGEPLRLANSELESGMQESSSCISCHARSALARRAGVPLRPAIFAGANDALAPLERRGFLGAPQTDWFADPDAHPGAGDTQHAVVPFFRSLDFVWSLALAHSHADMP